MMIANETDQAIELMAASRRDIAVALCRLIVRLDWLGLVCWQNISSADERDTRLTARPALQAPVF